MDNFGVRVQVGRVGFRERREWRRLLVCPQPVPDGAPPASGRQLEDDAGARRTAVLRLQVHVALKVSIDAALLSVVDGRLQRLLHALPA